MNNYLPPPSIQPYKYRAIRQVMRCDGHTTIGNVKPVNGIPTLSWVILSLTQWKYKQTIKTPAQIIFHSNRQNIITQINDSVNIHGTIKQTVNIRYRLITNI